MNKPQILVVEDDMAIGNLIATTLETQNYQYHRANTGAGAVMDALSFRPDVMLLDLGLPDMDGLEILSQLRDLPREVPVIIISARDRESEKVKALDMGADDYVVKPFSPKELMMRVAAIIKRSGGEENNRFVFEGLTVDFTARLVFIDEQRIEMSPKEYDLFFYMVRNRGVALTRERLIHDVWGYDFYGDDRTLDTHVKLLRKSLGRYSRCIITLRGVGYRFETVAEPESDADGDAN